MTLILIMIQNMVSKLTFIFMPEEPGVISLEVNEEVTFVQGTSPGECLKLLKAKLPKKGCTRYSKKRDIYC